MSRIRSTLDSVSRVVGSKDLISKLSRLRLGSSTVDGSNAGEVRVNAEPPSAASSSSAAQTSMTAPGLDRNMRVEGESQRQPDKEEPYVATSPMTGSAPSASAGDASATSSPPSASSVAKQTLQLFHPSTLSANVDETYNTFAKHVNSYFSVGADEQGDGTEGQQKQQQQQQRRRHGDHVRDHPQHHHRTPETAVEHLPLAVPVAGQSKPEEPRAAAPSSGSPSPPPPGKGTPLTENASPTPAPPPPTTSAKKGFTQYLSYPTPSMQAFVGSYIAPLVPKFRVEAKSIAVEKENGRAPGEAVEKGKKKKKEVEEVEKKEEESARKLLLTQREKIIARVSVDNRTRALVKGLQSVTDVRLLTGRVEELSRHLLEFPETRGVAVKERALPRLLRLRQASDPPLQAAVREALALVGYTDPVRGRGIRVLTIDGGGTRGLMALQTLHKLQELTGKPIHQLFDYICGVSTGAILAFMLGVFQIPLEECEEMYRKLGSDVFKQNVIVGTVKMGWSHAFYDSQVWENLLKERMGEGLMVESARGPNCPKVSAVSTIVNRGLPLKAYVFRNYRLMPGMRSHYLGDCKHKMWQAIRASSAAPGYFQEFVLGKDLHQDGGLLINNPTALAIHECKCLWPDTPLQCVVSLGTGRYDDGGKHSATYTSLRTKLTHIISSATDTEEVHTMLDALLPPDTYFRFNPLLSEDVPLDESRSERLNFLKSEGERYMLRNDAKLRRAAAVLAAPKGPVQRLADWAKLKTDMYDGLPFTSSKL
ncbi:calcium-independent phospholipase A2-gamma [Gadus macrocephalus]|uniref:calcium-independent phospholipase A2-gamma n=1 Tax=Gadus macrocephalus TaxID=80720 RepID=UPI0028CBBF69|nr:calcium-independent phospholipase A2-gamma [Gadus macrocephalus]